MSPEQEANFNREHPLGTMLIFRPRRTNVSVKPLTCESKGDRPTQEKNDINNRLCEEACQFVVVDYRTGRLPIKRKNITERREQDLKRLSGAPHTSKADAPESFSAELCSHRRAGFDDQSQRWL